MSNHEEARSLLTAGSELGVLSDLRSHLVRAILSRKLIVDSQLFLVG